MERVWGSIASVAVAKGVAPHKASFLIAKASQESGFGSGPNTTSNNLFSLQLTKEMLGDQPGASIERVQRVEVDEKSGRNVTKTVQSLVFRDVETATRVQLDVGFKIFRGAGRSLMNPRATIDDFAKALDRSLYAGQSRIDPKHQQKSLPVFHGEVVDLMVEIIDRGPSEELIGLLGKKDAQMLWNQAYSGLRKQLLSSKSPKHPVK